MTTWQPINTAPRDGTRILATWAHTWRTGPHIEVLETGEEGYWFYTFDGDAPVEEPTHWMPLPPDPNKE